VLTGERHSDASYLESPRTGATNRDSTTGREVLQALDPNMRPDFLEFGRDYRRERDQNGSTKKQRRIKPPLSWNINSLVCQLHSCFALGL
jgi:hypothetical protein